VRECDAHLASDEVLLEVVWAKSKQAPHLEERDATLGDKSSHVTLAHVQVSSCLQKVERMSLGRRAE
jgi:hypothetical protein